MTAMDPLLPIAIQREVQKELKIGEKLLWTGQPKPPSRSQAFVGALILFLAAGIFAVVAPQPAGKSRVFPIYVVPFLLLGLLGLLNPLLAHVLGAWQLYAVTDRRAIIFRGSRFSSAVAESYPPERLKEMGLVERDDQTGDLVFERNANDSMGVTHNYGFLRVENVREVDRLIRETLHAKHLGD